MTHRIPLVAAMVVVAFACARRPASDPPAPEGSAAEDAVAADEAEAEAAPDEGAPPSLTEPWEDLEANACLDAYARCLESLPEDRKDQLWLPYEQLQRGIETMREMNPDEIGPGCNGVMRMFRQSQVC